MASTTDTLLRQCVNGPSHPSIIASLFDKFLARKRGCKMLRLYNPSGQGMRVGKREVYLYIPLMTKEDVVIPGLSPNLT
jgi:hypothetical protein